MNGRWYRLPAGSPLGMTLEEADLRYLTGVSLIAIQRAGGEEVDYPNLKQSCKGDRLLVVGESEEVAAFDELARVRHCSRRTCLTGS